MARPLALLAVVSLAALVAALTASAGPPGSWTRLTEPNGRNIDEVGLARTPDGVLHVLWLRRDGPTNESIVHRTISPTGKAGAAGTVLKGFAAAGNPDAVLTSDQRLRVFFMGLGSTPEEGGVVSATAPLSGNGWTREGVRVSSSVSAVGPVAAAAAGTGGPVFSYAMTSRLGFHVGLDPAAQDQELQPDAKCCDYLPNLATDAGGQTMLTWYSNADGRNGTWARQVLPSVGPPLLAPGSVTAGKSLGRDQRTAITARLGAPGVYVAYCSGYPTCKRAMLWRVGAKKALPAGGSPDVEDVNVAPGPEGRLWVMWHDGQSSKTLFARRTNKAATRFGPIVRVKPPGGTTSIWKVKGEGSLGALDLLASVSTGNALATWHTQVQPPLSLGATRAKSTVTFRVTDAGDPVPGAKVKVAGKTLTTSAKGIAATKLGGAAKATASKGSYAPATIRVGA